MTKSISCSLLLLGAFWTTSVPAQSTRNSPAGATLEQIVLGLESDDFTQRDTAQQELGNLPADQYDALSAFAARQADEEVKSRLRQRIHEMVWELAQARPPALLHAAGHISGRLVDETGKPIGGGNAGASLPAWGQLLPSAAKSATDAEGRFDLPVPFVGVSYHVYLEMPGWGTSVGKQIVAGINSTAGDFVIKRGPSKSLRGSVVDSADSPVAHQPIRIIGGYGFARNGSTDAQGRFSIEGLPSYFGQPVAVVHAGNLVPPLEILRADEVTLRLVEAGTLSGKVLGDKGQPLAGVVVEAQPWFMNDLKMHARTIADGTYKITGVPPGDWLVSAQAPAFSHRPPQDRYTDLPRTTVKPGAGATADIVMERMAIVYGRVLDRAGQPVASAVLATKATWQRNHADEWRMVQTDPLGRFILATGQTARPNRPAENQLIVYSAQEGLATMPLRDLAPGDLRELNVTLPGSIHVAGHVLDPAGRPVPGVDCGYNVRTDADGRFDLGRVPRSPDGVTHLYLQAPRLPSKNQIMVLVNGTFKPFEDKPGFTERSQLPTFYAHQKVSLPAAGDATDLKITLQPAQLLEFTGIVRDAQGKPVSGAEVYLLAGKAKADTWLRMARPDGRGPGSWVDVFVVDRGKTGPDGRYTLWSVREEGDTVQASGAKFDMATLTLGVYDQGKAQLVEKIVVPPNGTAETHVQLEHP